MTDSPQNEPAQEPIASADGPYAPTARQDEYELPIGGFKGTPDEIERQWYQQCYVGRGDSMWQLTWRAVLMGSVLGGILSLTNLYIGLKSGWGFGVAITACILSYAIWMTFYKLRLVGTRMTVLENNCMQSTASAAGYSTGGTLVSAIAAYILVNNTTLPLGTLMAWVFFLAILGVTMAIPMKRQMINVEQLRFPSGIAAAETLRALHTTGGKGIMSAQALGIAGLLSALSKFWTEGLHLLGLAKFELSTMLGKVNSAVFGKFWTGNTVAFAWEPMFIAAGAITGIRVCTSMLVGGTLCWVFLTPWALDAGHIDLEIREPIPALPATVEFAQSGDLMLHKHAEWVPYARELAWKGVMSTEQRDTLLAQSDNPDYETAIRRLYVRSQYDIAVPLEGVSVTIPPKLRDLVQIDAERGLVSKGLLSVADYQKLQSLSDAPAYHDALDALYERSLLPSVEPMWVAADLPVKPERLVFPPALASWVTYDGTKNALLWRGAMTADQRDALAALSDDEAYRGAVATLFERSQQRGLPAPLPASAFAVVSYDEAAGRLRARGKIGEDLATALKALSDEPGYQYTIEQLVAGSAAERASANFRDLVKWSLWAGASCMVTSALFLFFFQWRSIVRAIAGLGSIFSRAKPGDLEAFQRLETPTWWFLAGQLVGGAGIVYLAYTTFDMPIWQSTLAIVLSFFLAIVACRVCGETDTTPVGAMGKVTQLMYGGIAPGKPNVNLMAACITAGAADSSSDLLIDLKSGYMLGANPRKQFLAQFAGIFMGTLASVLGFTLVVRTADDLGTAQFPAPAAQAWAAVAKLLGDGFDALHYTVVWAIIIGGAVGILLPLIEKLLPKEKWRVWVPSAAGLGLAFTFPWYYSLLFFIGAVIGLVIEKKWPKASEDFTFPVASGVIAGEALMGVALIFIEKGPQMFEQISSQLSGG